MKNKKEIIKGIIIGVIISILTIIILTSPLPTKIKAQTTTTSSYMIFKTPLQGFKFFKTTDIIGQQYVGVNTKTVYATSSNTDEIGMAYYLYQKTGKTYTGSLSPRLGCDYSNRSEECGNSYFSSVDLGEYAYDVYCTTNVGGRTACVDFGSIEYKLIEPVKVEPLYGSRMLMQLRYQDQEKRTDWGLFYSDSNYIAISSFPTSSAIYSTNKSGNNKHSIVIWMIPPGVRSDLINGAVIFGFLGNNQYNYVPIIAQTPDENSDPNQVATKEYVDGKEVIRVPRNGALDVYKYIGSKLVSYTRIHSDRNKNSIPLDMKAFIELCGDRDGCQTYVYTFSTDLDNAALTSFIKYNPETGKFVAGSEGGRASIGRDGDGAQEWIIWPWNCYIITDGEYVAGRNAGDNGIGVSSYNNCDTKEIYFIFKD